MFWFQGGKQLGLMNLYGVRIAEYHGDKTPFCLELLTPSNNSIILRAETNDDMLTYVQLLYLLLSVFYHDDYSNII